MGIAEVLTLIFIVLKLTHVIHWSWWGVFAPELIELAVVVVLGIVALAFGRGALRRFSR